MPTLFFSLFLDYFGRYEILGAMKAHGKKAYFKILSYL